MSDEINIFNYAQRLRAYFAGLPPKNRVLVLLASVLILGLACLRLFSESEEPEAAPTGPAAALQRDDTARGKEALLFLRLDFQLSPYTVQGGAQDGTQDGAKGEQKRAKAGLTLRLDEAACRNYYGGREGLIQCKNNWSFLEPETSGWSVSPALPGEWSFTPAEERYTAEFDFSSDAIPSGKEYVFRAPAKLGHRVRLAEYKAAFKSAPFQLGIQSWTFFSDPQNPRLNLLSAKVRSPYLLDAESFAAAVRLEPNASMGLGKAEIVLAQSGREASVTVPVTRLPEKSASVRLVLNKGVKRAGGPAESTPSAQSAGATVPGTDIFVSLEQAQSGIHTDDELMSRQTLILEFTRPVNVRQAQEATRALLLPRYADAEAERERRPTRWASHAPDARSVRAALAGKLAGLSLTPLPSPTEYSTVVTFSYSAAPGYFYLQNAGGAASDTGYALAPFRRVMEIRGIAPELRVMQKGHILSLNGAKTLAVFSRGLNKVELSARRVRPEFINLLITQNSGSLSQPEFYGNIDLEDMSESLSLSYKPGSSDAREPDYHALDLSPLLDKGGKGIFSLDLHGYLGNRTTVLDQRFLLLTDLGLNVKLEADGARVAFVSSFARGTPLQDAEVEVIGRNGLPVFSTRSSADGLARIPALAGLAREKRPVAIVARLGNDFTFMPLQDSSREVSLSPYPETAGRHVEAGGLSAFVFSERGLFKPGEELRFGVLLKSTAWEQASLEGLPIKAVLTNPRGIKIYEKQHTPDESGLFSVSAATGENDPTGRYSLDIYLDKKHLGAAQAQVEEFQPDNIRALASFSGISPARLRKGWLHPRDLKARVKVENLYGAPAVENKVSAGFSLTPARLAFSEYRDYRFFDPGQSGASQGASLGEARTDAAGEAEFSLGLDNYSGGAYRLNVEITAFESGGGRGVGAMAQTLVSPLRALVGWKSDAKLDFLAVNSKADVEFIAIDSALNRIEIPELEVKISEVEYVASLVRDSNGNYRYDKLRRLKTLSSSKAGGGKELSLSLPTAVTGEFELSLLDKSGSPLCNMFYVVAGGSQRRFGLERDATLRIRLDKPEYNSGEEMRVFVSAPYAGAGLITLESDRVISHQWFTAATSDSVQTLRVPDNFEGRAFVSVSLVRGLQSDAVHSAPYSYALAPFIVNIERRDLKLSLESQELIEPGESLRMRVQAEKPGKAIVFAVNEGILQMTSYRSPSPLTFFLKQNPLSVSTSQNWDLLMPEFHLMNQTVFGGGDDMLKEASSAFQLNPFRRKSEPSVVYWSGPVDVGPEGRELEWTVPAFFNGSLRVMAVAASADALGESSRVSQVRGPLIITPDLPVAVAPGDEFEVTAAIANNVEDSGELPVTVDVELSPGLEFMRRPERELRVAEGREGRAVFRLKATERLGESVVNITAESAFGGKALAVKRPVSLSVRPAAPRMSSFKAGFVKGREQVVQVGRSLFPQYAELEAGLSGMPLPMLDALSSFLLRFPHGCTEQILSAAFPYAVLNRSQEFLSLPRGMSPAQLRARSEKAVNRGIVALLEREGAVPGRFVLWPYQSYAYPYLSVYALDYLLSARESGFHTPEELLRNAGLGVFNILQGLPDSPDSLRLFSYAAWVYVRSGQRLSSLPQVVKHLDASFKGWRAEPAAALLAACYRMMRQDKEAEELIQGVKALDSKQAYRSGSWFYSRLWDNSLLLSSLAGSFPERLSGPEAQKALVHIINDISGNSYSTSSAAQAVRAIADYAAARVESMPGLSLTARDASGRELPAQAAGELIKRLSLGSEAAEFRFAGAEGLYWQISADGFDLKPREAQARKLIAKVAYIPVGGKKLEEVSQGDELWVLLTASAAEPLDNVAITSLLPGGFEMVISRYGRLSGGGNATPRGEDADDYEGAPESEGPEGYDEEEVEEDTGAEKDWLMGETRPEFNSARMEETRAMLAEAGLRGSPMRLVHVERREDRVIAYASLDQNESVFIYRVKAINKGRFTLPGIYAEALYDPDARAVTSPGALEVK